MRAQRVTRAIWGVAAALLAVSFVTPAVAADGDVRAVGRLSLKPPKGALPDSPGGALVTNSLARRGYQIFFTETGGTLIRFVDLDTLRFTGSLSLPKPVLALRSINQEFMHALDRENDVLYLPFLDTQRAENTLSFGGLFVVDGKTKKLVKTFDRLTSVNPSSSVGCTAPSCLPQTPGVSPAIQGIDYVPSYAAGGRPKILMQWQEPNGPGADLNSAVVWVAEWDPSDGHQNWAYQVRACSNRAMPTGSFSRYFFRLFHARVGTGVYLGCNGSGGTGQVVRLTLDTSGRPSAEAAFPGPTNVADVLADPNSDRMLLRVVNEEGESEWVFDGASNSFTGVVGIAPGQVATTTTIDPDSGRLYALSPPVAKGNVESAGGLLMSDIRRSPAPQAISFESFANGSDLAMAVDALPSGERHIFARMNSDPFFTILLDSVPISTDPPLTDLDRFTTDVNEKDDITSVNFTGTGHAWGMRVSLVGGLEGAPPTGPDASGYRVGRVIPKWLGSPCGTGDRRLVVADVRSAGLSNNLAGAAASPGTPDAGTGTDIGESTGRCYPYPKPNDADVFKPVFGNDYPQPLKTDTDGNGVSDVDEYAGSDWPFGVAECSADSKGASSTNLKPAARGGDAGLPDAVRDTKIVPKDIDDAAHAPDLPQQVRDTAVPMDGYTATAVCQQSKGRIEATSRAETFEGPSLADVGDVTVATVSSSVTVLKIRGQLVSRSIAIARGISVGNKISIDAAVTIAEARAGGRPGTAETTFYRRLCGVKIPDLNIHEDAVDLDLPPQGTPAGPVDPLDPDTDDVDIKELDIDGCGDPKQSAAGTQPIIDAMNTVLGSRGRVTAPDPDGELRQGTEGGYLASIQKDRLEQISARSVNNDDSPQVPALQIIMFNDDPTQGRGRQIYQFAGVDASVTYGIYLLNPDENFEDVPDLLIDLTGGTPFTPTIDPPPPTDQGAAPRRPGPLTILFTGIGFLLRSPKDALLAAAVWMLLFSPARLSARRRALRGLA